MRTILTLLFMVIATPCFAETYWIFIAKEGTSVTQNGVKTSYDAGEVVHYEIDKGQKYEDFSYSERQNNKIVQIDLTDDELKKLVNPEYEAKTITVATVNEVVDGKETTKTLTQTGYVMLQPTTVKLETVSTKDGEAVTDVKTLISSTTAKPSLATK